MPQDRNTHVAKLRAGLVLVVLLTLSSAQASLLITNFTNNPPALCAGYGDIQSISLTDWEAGLGSWTVGTRNVRNPTTFDTPDWAVVGSLPDSQPGMAAFVANLDIGDCALDDETGALTLDSPPIVIPGGTQVPRISIDHWFQIESGWDGGNFKISVNGGSFTLVPASAIEVGPYNDTLFPALDEFGSENNSNPLADQDAFTSIFDGQPTGSWVRSYINLLGIAAAGDTIQLRFDFGIDGCGGAIGWYVDEVEFYSCADEFPPSNCGNGVINGGEQCDDGNNFIGDGCSSTCQIEDGWQCTAPTPPGTIADPSFEAGTPNPSWVEVSNNPIGTPICRTSVCGTGGGSGPSDGTYWAWFGGVFSAHEGSLSQSIVIPATATDLTFDLEIPACDSAADYVEVLIDANQEMLIDGSSPLCGIDGYATLAVDVSAYADGGTHSLQFHSETFSINTGVSNFFIDVVGLPGSPSICRREGTSLTLIKESINDDGGDSFPSAWMLTATGPTGFSGTGPTVFSGGGFLPGTYELTESGPAGYSASAWVCVGGTQVDGDTITLALDEAATCTITNDDTAPTLTLVKQVINDNGGTITDPDAFGLKIDGVAVLHNAVNTLDAGDHTVSETTLPGYQAGSWGGDCNPDGSIALALGQNATCSITNDDITATLTVVKTIVNDNGGGVIDENAFGLKIDGVAVLHNAVNAVDAGNHTVSEDGQPGYVPSTWGGDCNADGTITLALDQDAVCNITNDDSNATSLTLVKQVINDNGGNAQGSAWTLTATGPSGFSGPGPSVFSGEGISPGNYDLSESGGPAGYSASAWVCVGGSQVDGDTITLALGEAATCTITNDDISPTLTVVKTIVNDNGGTVTDENAFGLKIDGLGVAHNAVNAVDVGLHTVSEDGLPGYVPSTWGGDCNPDGTITLALDQDATCTISNDDITPTLTVVKTIVNDNGGTVTDENAFGLKVDGLGVLHNAANPFDAGLHTVSEDGLAGYAAGAWGGDCNPDGTITLVLDQDATCTVTNDDSAATLTVVKTIVNDNGGTVTDENAFGLKVDGAAVLHNATNPFDAGLHTVSEDGLAGYAAGTWGGDCNPDGTITLALGQEATCTISNDDISPTLTVVKTIINDNGGTVTDENAFGLKVDVVGVLHNATNTFDAGLHKVSEDGLPGYQAGPWGGDCNPDGTITLALNQDAVCTVTNDDSAATLTVVKTIVNDNGGTVMDENAFGLKVDGIGVLHNATNPFDAGLHTVSEDGLSGYAAGTWGGDCNPDGTITLALGQDATCTITNDDISPTLTVVKTIVNDNGGGVIDENAFGLKIDGVAVLHNAVNAVDAGNHTVSEDGQPGYVPSTWGGDCNADGTITLALDQDAVCNITNDDSNATSLTLVKQVINDNGGNAQGSAWTLTATGPSGFSGPGPSVFSGEGISPGNYDLSESGGPAGYSASAWVCVGGSQVDGDTITLALGEAATCTITNDDISPTLTVVKTIVNDNGGTVTDENAFGLKIDGLGVAHNAVNAVDVGLHTVSEDGLPGYVPSTWGGDCNPDGTITLALDQDATCTITNDDVSPTLTVIKTIVNDNGGGVTDENAFGLKIDGLAVAHNAVNAADAGNHTVSEDGQPGYVPSTWGGDCNPDGTITLVLDQDATCTITNDDSNTTSLTLVKQVINDNGGSAQGSAWTLTATGPSGFSGPGPNVFSGEGISPGDYDLSESGGPAGYSASAWVCVGGSQVDADTITLALGEVATCTISNDDIAPTLTVVKTIVNDNGGGVTDENVFGLKVDGVAVLHNAVNEVDAGNHTVSEDGQPGYVPSTWGGDCNADGTITLALDQDATCTITNDDSAATLTVVKTIVNDNGGTVTDENAFGLKVDGIGVLHNAANSFDAGLHTVSEDGLAGYAAGTWGGDCNPDGTITLVLDQDATCTITNDDSVATLTVVKTIVNDNGGTVTDENAFGLKVDGIGVLHNATNPFDAGLHTVSEDGLPGYQAGSWGGECNPDGTITLALGQEATCSITNDDSAATLTVVKTIVNDNGGTVTDENAFGLKVDGVGVLHNATNTFDAGLHTVSEDGLPGYQPGTWGGDCNPDGTITLALGQEATCTISNDDISPTLTVVKTIVNDNGGSITDEDAFGLKVDGVGVLHNATNTFDAGLHTVSEDGMPGYQAGSWGGDCNPDGTITLALDQDAICTISNDDISPTLTVVKTIVNDNGGTVTDENAFGLKVDGLAVLHNAANPVNVGLHTVSEDGLPVYQAGAWGGDCNPDGTIALILDQDATCTISNDDITPTLTVVKTIVNDNGGTITDENAFGLKIDGIGVLHNASNDIDAGSHTVSEDGLAGYQAGSWGGECNPDGTVTLALDQDATCTLTNNDAEPGLTLVKEVTNDSGGTALPSAWTLSATGPTGFSGAGPSVTNGAGFEAGSYDLLESGGPAGYSAGSWVCVGGTQDDADTITLALGETATCTIINDDITPTLTVVKTIVNDNGGTITDENAFGLKIDGVGVAHNATNDIDAGSHTVSEDGLAGYQAGDWGADCNPDGTIELSLDQDATCTLTNDDAEPSLTLVKEVTNDNGGSALPSAWTLTATGPTGFSGAGPSVSNGAGFKAGTYDLSESGGPAGYSNADWVCVGGTQDDADTITLALGETATCTIINDDDEPGLTLVKEVTNDNGGTAPPSAWTLTATGPTGFSGTGPSVSNDPGFEAGTYDLSESGSPDGYTASDWVCVGGTQDDADTITLALGETATCTLINDDVQPGLTLVKEVSNDNGGTAPASTWILTATGPTGFSGAGPSVSNDPGFEAGTYDLSESGGPAGYSAGDWVCAGGTQDDADTVTLALGEAATCTIINDDDEPGLSLVKEVSNDNGGTALASAWILTATGPTGFSGAGPSVSNGAGFEAGSYDLSESGGPDGYTASDWICVGGTQDDADTITLALGETASCTISNDDIEPGLTLVKKVTNNNEGTAKPSDWTLTAAGPTGFSGTGPSVSNGAGFEAGSYDLSESGSPEGYTASDWTCVGGTQDDADTITLGPGEAATCTITNDDEGFNPVIFVNGFESN